MMCTKCVALTNASAPGLPVAHLAHPRDASRRGEFDIYGFARCVDPECSTLWYLDVAQQLTAVGIKGDWLFPRKPPKRAMRNEY